MWLEGIPRVGPVGKMGFWVPMPIPANTAQDLDPKFNSLQADVGFLEGLVDLSIKRGWKALTLVTRLGTVAGPPPPPHLLSPGAWRVNPRKHSTCFGVI